MAIKLEWAQFSKFDSMNVYRSTSSIDTENLPTPLATGLTTMYYFDSTAVDGETYYYVVGMWLDGVEYLSSEISIYAGTYLFKMDYSADFADSGIFNFPYVVTGSPMITKNGVYLPVGSHLAYDTSQLSEHMVGTEDFEIGVEVIMLNTGNSFYPCIFALGNIWGNGALSLQYGSYNGNFMCATIPVSSEVDAYAPLAQQFDSETSVKYVVRRVSGIITTYIIDPDGNETAGAGVASALDFDLGRNDVFTVGYAGWNSAVESGCYIKNLYLKLL